MLCKSEQIARRYCESGRPIAVERRKSKAYACRICRSGLFAFAAYTSFIYTRLLTADSLQQARHDWMIVQQYVRSCIGCINSMTKHSCVWSYERCCAVFMSHFKSRLILTRYNAATVLICKVLPNV